MNRIEKAAVINYPFHPNASERSGLYAAAIVRQLAFRAGYEQGAKEFAEWLANQDWIWDICNWYNLSSGKSATTAQLFEIFKNEQ